MALIFTLSSFERLPQPPAGLTDKHVHAMAFGLLAALWLRALAAARLACVTWRRAVAAAVLATAWGVVDEFHQRTVPGRQAEIADLIADTAGAAVASVGCVIIARFAAGRRSADGPNA